MFQNGPSIDVGTVEDQVFELIDVGVQNSMDDLGFESFSNSASDKKQQRVTDYFTLWEI